MARTISERRTMRANKTFRKASQAERRVIIAKDALKQISRRTFRVKAGSYLGRPRDVRLIPYETAESAQVCDVLTPSVTCQGCARAALFLSAVRKFNNLKVSELNGGWAIDPDDPGMQKVERAHFGKQRSILIEQAFEGEVIWSHGENAKMNPAALAFYLRHRKGGAKARLIAILNNIVRNKGEFKP